VAALSHWQLRREFRFIAIEAQEKISVIRLREVERSDLFGQFAINLIRFVFTLLLKDRDTVPCMPNQ
jgi:hypothetical protein